MTDRQKARFELILDAQRQQIHYEIEACRKRSVIDGCGDTIDQIRDAGEREFALRNLARLTALLRLVDTALEQLRAGTYGACAGCGCEIPMKRLQAVPWSAFCITCQDMIETTRPLTPEPAGGGWNEPRLN
jgi:DnaK suppressor protein